MGFLRYFVVGDCGKCVGYFFDSFFYGSDQYVFNEWVEFGPEGYFHFGVFFFFLQELNPDKEFEGDVFGF